MNPYVEQRLQAMRRSYDRSEDRVQRWYHYTMDHGSLFQRVGATVVAYLPGFIVIGGIVAAGFGLGKILQRLGLM